MNLSAAAPLDDNSDAIIRDEDTTYAAPYVRNPALDAYLAQFR